MPGARAGSAPPRPAPAPPAKAPRPNPRRSASAGDTPPLAAAPPSLRPLFLWVATSDTLVLKVHCEDYDQRNRLRLTRTPIGWRALPRTDTYDSWRLPRAPAPPARRRARRGRPRKRIDPESAPPPPLPPLDTDCETPDDASWNLPDIEARIPSHTIHVPPRSPPKPLRQEFDPTPLDNLLAVAELEFENQRRDSGEISYDDELDDVASADVLRRRLAEFPFLTDGTSFESSDGSTKRSRLDDDKMLADDGAYSDGAKDLFETISDGRYMTDELDTHDDEDAMNANELLDSLVEKGCEDNDLGDPTFHKIVDEPDGDGDYDDEDDDMLVDDAPVSAIIHRLEQSLESPGQHSITAAQGLLNLQHAGDHLADVETLPQDDDATYGVDEYKHDECAIERLVESVQPIDDKPEVENSVLDDAEAFANLAATEVSEIQNDASESFAETCTEVDYTATDINSKNDDSDREHEANRPDERCEVIETPKEDDELPESTDDMMPTDLSVKPTTLDNVDDVADDVADDRTDEMSDKSDEMPKDLSCRKRVSSPFPSPKRIETPRPPSRGSDTIQSPQPSGIPAVPSSPELFQAPLCKSSSKSVCLETLLALPSPKMCFSSELTITKHQNEPLNLGKSRKSASPTVSSCSEEIKKHPKEFGEPEEKRYRKDSIDEPPLQKLNKLFSKSTENVLESKQKKPDARSHRTTEELTPLKQLQLLRSSTEFKIPDPLLVPKDKFSAIMMSPAKEIPALLLQRPELRLPDAFAYPTVLKDPDILVVSLSQLEMIMQKHNIFSDKDAFKDKPSKYKSNMLNTMTDLNLNPMTATSPLDVCAKTGIGSTVPGLGTDSLAGDIDAATTAAFNQMLWLPYLNQFETAMACSQNPDFLKALNSTMPPGYPAQPTGYADLFSPQSRFMGSAGFPVMPLEYNNPLEFAMWQEAVAQANNVNFQRALKNNMASDNQMKDLHKNVDAQSLYSNASKHQQMRSHSSARTSPIAHGYQHARGGPGVGYHPGGWPGYPAGRVSQQAAQYSPGGPRSGRHHQPSPSSSASPSNFYQNNNYLNAPKSNGGRHPATSSSHPNTTSEQRPRISVKSLQNLLEPTSPALGAGMSLMHRPLEPEVGSSTHLSDEAAHDAQAALWHPLFGNHQKNYNSPWNWTTVTVNGD